MSNQSLIYKNIYLYRFIINILYVGRYGSRFKNIIKLIKDSKQIVDLCFGDIYIAKYCKDNGVRWTGYDLNESFVKNAINKGYNAYQADIIKLETIPTCDVCIIQGSLYHFHDSIENLLKLIFSSTKRLIISEPIKNLSSSNGIIGQMARLSANAGKGNERFRYSEKSIIDMLDIYKNIFNFEYAIVSKKRDIIIEILVK